MKKAMSYAKEFFHRADIFLLVMGLICAIFGIVVISSATASYHSAKYVIVQSASLILGVFALHQSFADQESRKTEPFQLKKFLPRGKSALCDHQRSVRCLLDKFPRDIE